MRPRIFPLHSRAFSFMLIDARIAYGGTDRGAFLLKSVIGILVSLFLPCLPLTGVARAQSLTVMTEDYPPLNFLKDGKAQGPSVEVVRLIMKEAGEDGTIQVLPWARAYMLTSNQENHILFSMTRIESREKLFKWVGPLAIKHHAFYLLRDSGITLKSLDDARGLIIGVQLNGVDQDFLVKQRFTNLDGISHWQLNARKLMSGRIDAWLASTVSADAVLRDLHLTDRIERSIQAFERPLYIAFNKNTDDSVIRKWQAVRDRLYHDGTAREIFMRHGQIALFPAD